MMTFMVMSGLVFSWILANIDGLVAGSTPAAITAAGFEAAFLL